MKDELSNLPEIDFPYMRGAVRGCEVCMKNVPTGQTRTFKDAEGNWHTVCADCESKGA